MTIPTPAAWATLPTRPVVVGHRGMGRSYAPLTPLTHTQVENTRASFAAAAGAGAEWVELDVVASRDDVLFLWHSHYVDGIPVHEVPAATLDALGIERFLGLAEDLPPGLGVNVEAKPMPMLRSSSRHGEEELVQEACVLAATRPVLWSSFDPMVARAGSEAGLLSAWITRQGYPLHEAVMGASNAGTDAVVVHGLSTLEAGDDRDLALGWRLARDLGVSLWCWDVSLGAVASLATAGVTGFCTDEVSGVAAALAEQQPRPTQEGR